MFRSPEAEIAASPRPSTARPCRTGWRPDVLPIQVRSGRDPQLSGGRAGTAPGVPALTGRPQTAIGLSDRSVPYRDSPALRCVTRRPATHHRNESGTRGHSAATGKREPQGQLQGRLQRSRPRLREGDELDLDMERLNHALNGVEGCRKRTPRRVVAGETAARGAQSGLGQAPCAS